MVRAESFCAEPSVGLWTHVDVCNCHIMPCILSTKPYGQYNGFLAHPPRSHGHCSTPSHPGEGHYHIPGDLGGPECS